MKHELEIKHLKNYLDTDLRMMRVENGKNINESILTPTFLHEQRWQYTWKPILRPLSDLFTDEYELKIQSWFKYPNVLLEKYSEHTLTATYSDDDEVYTDFIVFRNSIDNTDYWIVENLLKNHFDVFNLIEKGRAIDINTIESE